MITAVTRTPPARSAAAEPPPIRRSCAGRGGRSDTTTRCGSGARLVGSGRRAAQRRRRADHPAHGARRDWHSACNRVLPPDTLRMCPTTRVERVGERKKPVARTRGERAQADRLLRLTLPEPSSPDFPYLSDFMWLGTQDRRLLMAPNRRRVSKVQSGVVRDAEVHNIDSSARRSGSMFGCSK